MSWAKPDSSINTSGRLSSVCFCTSSQKVDRFSGVAFGCCRVFFIGDPHVLESIPYTILTHTKTSSSLKLVGIWVLLHILLQCLLVDFTRPITFFYAFNIFRPPHHASNANSTATSAMLRPSSRRIFKTCLRISRE